MRHDKKEKIDIVLKYLPSIFTSLAEKDTDSLCEIRLRADRPVALDGLIILQNRDGSPVFIRLIFFHFREPKLKKSLFACADIPYTV